MYAMANAEIQRTEWDRKVWPFLQFVQGELSSMLNQKEQQQREEFAVFSRFAETVRLNIVPGSVKQPGDPAPDIVVEIVGEGIVGFELGTIEHSDHLKRRDLMNKSPKIVNKFHRSLRPAERAAFDERFGNAYLSFEFDESRGVYGVTAAVPALFQALMELPADSVGPVLIRRINGLRYAWIGRDKSYAGPEFYSSASGYVMSLNLQTLEKKLNKKDYECAGPVDLVLYADENSHASDEETIRELLYRLLPKSQYRTIWIYEDMQRKATAYHR